MYFYRDNSEGKTRSQFCIEKLDYIEVYKKMVQITRKKYPELSRKAYTRYLIAISMKLEEMEMSDNFEVKEISNRYKQVLRKKFLYLLCTDYLVIKAKGKIFLICFLGTVYKFMFMRR